MYSQSDMIFASPDRIILWQSSLWQMFKVIYNHIMQHSEDISKEVRLWDALPTFELFDNPNCLPNAGRFLLTARNLS